MDTIFLRHMSIFWNKHNYCYTYRSMSFNSQIMSTFYRQLKQINTQINKSWWVSYSSFQPELNTQVSILCCLFLFYSFILHICMSVCVYVCVYAHTLFFLLTKTPIVLQVIYIYTWTWNWFREKILSFNKDTYRTLSHIYISTPEHGIDLEESFFLLVKTPIVLQVQVI